MAYTAKKKADGNYEVFKDGARISTGSVGALAQYGLSATNLGGGTTPTPTPTPASTPTYTPPTTVIPKKKAPPISDYIINLLRTNIQSGAATPETALKAMQSMVSSGGYSAPLGGIESSLFSGLTGIKQKDGSIGDFAPFTGGIPQIITTARPNQVTQVTGSGVQRQSGVLTPQQQTEYFATQGQSATPLSPTDWLKSQTVINKDSISKMPSVVNAPAPSTGTTPELPIPQVGNIQDAFSVSMQSKVDTARTTLENTYKTQLEDAKKRMEMLDQENEDLTTLQAEGIEKAGELQQPWREKKLEAERELKYINENFEANQALVNELETLLTEGNELIRQQKEITGLSAIRNPRIDKTISDVNARAGIIEATISFRQGQINEARTQINKTLEAITLDKQDQLNYYETLHNFYQNQKDEKGNKLIILSREKQALIEAQRSLLQGDLAQAENNANYIKDLMTDPDSALFMARAGVSLNDTPETVNQKMAQESQR